MKIFRYSFLIVLISFFACKKKSSDDEAINPFICKYFPMSNGSTWVYQELVNGVQITTTNIVSNASSSSGTLSATVTRGAAAPEQVVCLNGAVTGTSNNPITGSITLTFLKEAAAKDSVWNHFHQIQGVPAKFEFKVIDKGINRMVNGDSYSDVIHMQESLYLDNGSGFTLVESSNTYYAPFVGVIEKFTNALNNSLLLNYNINQ